jgi:quercetin dioxygenase-like cupin family protein
MASTETTSPRAYGLEPSEGQRLWIVGDTLNFKATAAQTGGSLTALVIDCPPGSGPPPHVHANEDESFYVLEGEFGILHGEDTFRATKGAFAFVPRGTLHRFQNIGDTDGRILIMFTPGGMDGFFFESGLPVVEGETAPPFGPEEVERSREAAIRYGMDVLWPEA